MSINRPCNRFRLSRGIDARLIHHFIEQTLDQLPGRRHLGGQWRDRWLISIQDNSRAMRADLIRIVAALSMISD
jgi:hypothetical protein